MSLSAAPTWTEPPYRRSCAPIEVSMVLVRLANPPLVPLRFCGGYAPHKLNSGSEGGGSAGWVLRHRRQTDSDGAAQRVDRRARGGARNSARCPSCSTSVSLRSSAAFVRAESSTAAYKRLASNARA